VFLCCHYKTILWNKASQHFGRQAMRGFSGLPKYMTYDLSIYNLANSTTCSIGKSGGRTSSCHIQSTQTAYMSNIHHVFNLLLQRIMHCLRLHLLGQSCWLFIINWWAVSILVFIGVLLFRVAQLLCVVVIVIVVNLLWRIKQLWLEWL